MNRIAKLLALAIAVFALQSVTLNGLAFAQTPVEAIPVPEPEPADAEPGLIELDLDDEFETDDELSELDDSDEFKLIPVPDETPDDDDTVEIVEDDSPLLILQEEVNSSRKDVISDSKVAPASHETVVSGSTMTSTESGSQPLLLESPDSEASSLEPIVDRQMSSSTGSTSSPGNAKSSGSGGLEFIPNQPGIVAGNSTPVQSYGQRVVRPTSPPVIQPGVVYQQPRVYYRSNSQPGVTSGNATYRYQQVQPGQQVRVIRPGVGTNRVPTVMQQPVAQPVVVQQGYRSWAPSDVARNGVPNGVTNSVASPTVQYSQNPTTVRRVVQTGPNTYRVTTETTQYVPVQVQQRTPVYQPGLPARTVRPQAVPVQAAPQPYIQGRPVLNAIRGAFR